MTPDIVLVCIRFSQVYSVYLFMDVDPYLRLNTLKNGSELYFWLLACCNVMRTLFTIRRGQIRPRPASIQSQHHVNPLDSFVKDTHR